MNSFLVFGLFLVLSACANKALMHSGLVPKSPIKVEQAVITSPNEKNWFLMQNDLHSAVFVKKYDNTQETAVINVSMYQVGKAKTSKLFLEGIADQRLKLDDKKRFKILKVKNDFVEFKELPCLKYQTLSEDHKDLGVESKAFEYFKTSGYICRYPLDYTAIQMEVSHRSKNQEMPNELVAVAQEFFNDIGLVEETVKKLKTVP